MDDEKIKNAIKHFKFRARPNNAHSSAPATVEDIEKLIKETSILVAEVTKAMKD